MIADCGGGKRRARSRVTECLRKLRRSASENSAQKLLGLSVIHELIADGEKALHPTDRFGDYAVRLSGLKLVF